MEQRSDDMVEIRAALPSQQTSPKRLHRSFVLQCALLLCIWLVFLFTAVVSRDDARIEAATTLENLSAAVALDLAHNVELLDLALQDAAAGWGNDEIRALKPSLRKVAVFDLAFSNQRLGRFLIVDQYGAVLANSDENVPVEGSYADRPEFRAHVGDILVRLYVGPAFRDPANQEWSIPFSRRINTPDGGFAGVVMGTLRLSAVQSTYQRIGLGTGGLLALATDDGDLLQREPPPPQDLVDHPIRLSDARVAQQTNQGWFETVSKVDGIKRAYGYHRVGTLPLVQYAGQPTTAIYADWMSRTLVMALILLILSVAAVTLQLNLRAELMSRMAAERSLEELAAKDPLTGIANRRVFNAAASREWKASLGHRLPVGLLMIDVDHFKSFNDHHGHLRGDQVLIQIAESMSEVADRYRGLASRFGGEEFAILLPRTDRTIVRAAARDVIDLVRARAMLHAGSPGGTVSVSVGAAIAVPEMDTPLDALVAAADRQLYEAKARGRDCASVIDDAARQAAA